jgi:hypothetical protein
MINMRRAARALETLGGVTVGGAHLQNPFMTASGLSLIHI